MKVSRLMGLLFGICGAWGCLAQAGETLPQLNIDPSRITVSGLSAGAFMAVQLEVAYSSLYSGAAAFAGGIYACAEGNVISAQLQCMAEPDQLDASHFTRIAREQEKLGGIDPLSNLSSHRVYIFSGTQDTTVLPRSGEVLTSFYKEFIPSDQILFKNDLAAEHGQPTLSSGVDCTVGGSPWILDCGYDGAGAALQQLFSGKLSAPVSADPSHLTAFDQTRFAAPEALMGHKGYIYVPTGCTQSDPPCALHIALHGCKQSPDALGDAYRTEAGYNEWAEANHIVVLYPSATASSLNPNGCWDWWGYTGPAYFTKTGLQMKAIRDMTAWIARLPH